MRDNAPPDPLAIGSMRRVFDEVYGRLRSAIITGHLGPGARIVERELTARLQVSRTPIREALKRLEQEGLIVCFPHRGCFVRSPSMEEARQAYEFRRVAEGLCGELAAQRATAEDLASMQNIVRKGRSAVQAGDRQTALLINNQLHEAQARAARNVFLIQQLRTLWAYVDLLRGRSWVQTERAYETQREHEAILEALLRRDAARAKELNEAHVDHAWAAVKSRFFEQNDAESGAAAESLAP